MRYRLRSRRVLVILLSLLPALAAGSLWAHSYWRRDLLVWEGRRAESRRLTCQVYSSWGRLCLLSYSRPDPDPADSLRPTTLESADRALSEALADDVRNQLEQAGVMGAGTFGFAYSQHVGDMAAGTHVWTAAIVPWWCVAALTLVLPGYLVARAGRPRVALSPQAPAAVEGRAPPPPPPGSGEKGPRRPQAHPR